MGLRKYRLYLVSDVSDKMCWAVCTMAESSKIFIHIFRDITLDLHWSGSKSESPSTDTPTGFGGSLCSHPWALIAHGVRNAAESTAWENTAWYSFCALAIKKNSAVAGSLLYFFYIRLDLKWILILIGPMSAYIFWRRKSDSISLYLWRNLFIR